MKKYLHLSFSNFIMNQFFYYWYYYFLAFLSLFLVHYSQSLIPEYIKELGSLKSISEVQSISISKYIYVALSIILFRTISRFVFFLPARLLQKSTKLEFLDLIEKSNPLRFKKYTDGDIFNLLHHDFNSIRGLIGFAFLQIGNIALACIVFFPKIYEFNSKLLIAFLPLLLSFLIFTIIMFYFAPYFKIIMEEKSKLQNFMIESYKGKRSVKNFQAEKNVSDIFDIYSQRELNVFFKSSIGASASMPLIKLGVGISFIWGCIIIQQEALGAEAILFFSGFIFLFLEPLSMVSWIGGVFVRSFASWNRIQDFIRSCKTETKHEVELERFSKKLKFQRSSIDFEFLLRDQIHNFKIFLNSKNAIVGKTGIGKSYLLENLYFLLRINSKDSVFVSQTPYLFNDTIINNIFLGNEINESKILKAKELLKIFLLNDVNSDLDELLNLEVGENGTQLSGGQAQRVCLIRSIMMDTSIIIWDDPFSSIDLIQESIIWDQLREFIKNKTLILSTHRLTTVKSCEHLIFIDELERDKNKSVCDVVSMEVDRELNRNGRLNEFFEEQMA